MRAEEVVVAVGISLIFVAMAVSVAGLFESLDLHLTRKCPLSEYGRCKGVGTAHDGLPWGPVCSGHSVRCRRRRQALDDVPDGIVPDNRDA